MTVTVSVTEPLTDARRRTLALVDGISDDELERVHSPLMSPLVWDLGHIAAFEDLWLVHRLGGAPMLRGDLADVYDAFETPRAGRGELPFLRPGEARAYLEQVRERAREVLDRDAGTSPIPELVVRHELQHQETMLQTMQLARLHGGRPAAFRAGESSPPERHTGLETVEVAAGPFELGAGPEGFAYDNERRRHRVELPAFRIGRTPVTNATWMHFAEGGGYERREWWTDEAWHWKEEYDITHPMGWTDDGREWRLGALEDLDPDKPVVHVSWFEADAFARAHGLRLPTEAEWEKAATWDLAAQTKRRWPWGEERPDATRANLDAKLPGPARAGALTAGASPYGALGMSGDVWEWTASDFRPYPGFAAHPYREYSEVFFGSNYRVLRGGSWATAARVGVPTFRNWDLPQRRQIFAGVRLAGDVS